MILDRRLAIAAVILAAGVGCSPAEPSTSSSTTIFAQTTSVSAVPAATTTTVSPPPTSAAKPAMPVDVSITPEGETTVTLGGPPLRFTVTLENTGPDIAQVGLVVSLGHCSCGPPGASMMAEGTMRMLDPQTDAWVDVPYVREGTGMDYIMGNLVPPFPLSHGQTVSYQLEMAVNAEQDFPVTDGETSIGVTLTHPDDPMEGDPLGSASLHPITVET